METKNILPWAIALTFGVLASTQLLHAAGGQKGTAQPLGVAQPVKPPKWQYKVEKIFGSDGSSQTGAGGWFEVSRPYDQVGQDGWELAAVLPVASDVKTFRNGPVTNYTSVLIFKKQL